MKRSQKHFHEDLSTGEAARFCKVHPQTIINWCDIGRLKWSRFEDGPRRIPRQEIVELLRRNRMEIPAELTEHLA